MCLSSLTHGKPTKPFVGILLDMGGKGGGGQKKHPLLEIFKLINIAGLDIGDRQVLEQKYNGCDPPCLLDSSDGRLIFP